MELAWQSTGHIQEVIGTVDRVPAFDPRAGEHLWVISSMYRWGGTDNPILDMENLLLVVGPGCYYCEQPWTKLLASRRCKGQPPDAF